MNMLPLAFAFSAGVLASVNPCAFVMLPGFVSYYLGGKETEEVSTTGRLSTALLLGIAVTTGFMVLFVSIGVVFSAGGQFLFRTLPALSLVIGIFLVVAGVWTLLGRALPITLPTFTIKRFGRGPQAGSRKASSCLSVIASAWGQCWFLWRLAQRYSKVR